MRRKLVSVSLLILISGFNQAKAGDDEDLLLFDDEFVFESEGYELEPKSKEFEPKSNELGLEKTRSNGLSKLREYLRFTLQASGALGSQVDLARASIKVEVDGPLWGGAYFRIDHEARYFSEKDRLAEVHGSAYQFDSSNEAWLQLSAANCESKIGRQFLFWGNVEGAFAVDVVTPIDFTETLLTDFSELRLPQDMAVFNCYLEKVNLEAFYVPEAKLSRLAHKGFDSLKALEKTLSNEWGFRANFSKQAYELSLMYARLYASSANVLIDQSSGLPFFHAQEFDMFASSLAWASESVMLELDLAYKSEQLVTLAGADGKAADLEGRVEAALGFEYLSSANHQLNGGLWLYEAFEENTGRSVMNRSWNLSWSKSYLNDELSMSVLGVWLENSDLLTSTLLASYDFNDYWQGTTALSYSNRSAPDSLVLPSAKLSLFASLEFQF